MSYSKLSQKRNSTRKTLNEAKLELTELESKKEELFSALEEVEEQRIEAKAAAKVGSGSKKDSEAAQDEYKSVKSNLDKVRDDIAIQHKAIEMLKQRYQDITTEFRKVAKQYHKEKLQPKFDTIDECLKKINDTIDELTGYYQKEMQPDGIRKSEVLGKIDHGSEAVITKGKLASVDRKNFITQPKPQNA